MKKSTNTLVKNIRLNILKLTYKAKSAHIGSALSIVEILAILYNEILNINPPKKNFLYRDRFILSKGHAALALYCTLYEKSFITKNTLDSFGNENTILMNHVSHKVPGVEFSTGSLGHGLPIAIGKSLNAKRYNKKWKIYALLSDGELNEGSNWEGLMFAAHHNLNNLTIVIDYNKMQSLDYVKNTIGLEPLKEKFKSFGCNVLDINGHSLLQLRKAFSNKIQNKPKVIIANTIKGKGVSFMENNILWHYTPPDKFQLKKALIEIDKRYA